MRALSTIFLLCLALSSQAQTIVDFHTTRGDFRVQLREDIMPITAGNFISLVDSGYYDGVIFHRVIDGFVIQGGDPTGTGSGGPGYTIMDEYHPTMNHDSAGVIAMAKTSAPNSAGSQFYFTLDSVNRLDQRYSVFGSCIDGLNVILTIGKVRTDNNDRPLFTVMMDSVRIYDPTASIEALSHNVLTEVYPNPFQGAANIRYQVKKAEKVLITMHDV
ncbi:MAG: peptidylprolyl isomerase, partial [Bacteroidia bacterium]